MLPGTDTTTGKMAYGLGAALLVTVCVWHTVRQSRTPEMRMVPHMVVCDACGALELDREVPVGADGAPQLPIACSKCGAKAVYLAVYCPACGKPIPVDPAKPPAQCKHCGADLKALFAPPAR